MTLEQAVVDLAEGSADLMPALRRLKLTVTRIDDPELTKRIEEVVNLNGRMWNAVSILIHHAEASLHEKE
jgi:hypothetical protein